jgi:hypothetical protein
MAHRKDNWPIVREDFGLLDCYQPVIRIVTERASGAPRTSVSGNDRVRHRGKRKPAKEIGPRQQLSAFPAEQPVDPAAVEPTGQPRRLVRSAQHDTAPWKRVHVLQRGSECQSAKGMADDRVLLAATRQ